MLTRLMGTIRFGPLFWTQFLGAFNDNFFKNALVILITFRSVHVLGIPPEQMVAFSAAVFMLPYFLFSAAAGRLADKVDKATLIRVTKVAEVVVMGLGAAGFLLGDALLLLGVLFLMGLQSTVFGPVKYAILPGHLEEDELVAGNALIETGTYLAILLGTIAGGLLINLPSGDLVVAVGVVSTALGGLLAAQRIPAAPSVAPDQAVALGDLVPGPGLFRLLTAYRPIWLSILGITWFWTLGAVLLSLFPTYTKDVLGGDESVATLFLALFSVGIGLGSLLCHRLSRERVELGLVPVGAFGMTVFLLDLWWIGVPWEAEASALNAAALLQTVTGLRIAFDLVALSLFGGFLIVPLYSFVQWRSEPQERAQIIAGNNIVNAIGITSGSLVLMGGFAVGFDAVDVLLGLAATNVVVAVVMYTQVAEYLLRFAAWIVSFGVYRLAVQGEERIPADGPCLIVCNHVTFIDWFVIMAAVRRQLRFVVYHKYAQMPLISFFFRQNRVIPIAGKSEDPALLEQAMSQIDEALQQGWAVLIFPEGGLTSDGDLLPFRKGIEHILQRTPVPVIPMALTGLWGSFFSRKDGSAFRRPFRRVWSRIWVTVGEAMEPSDVTAERAQEAVRALRQDKAA
ncbi:MAG: MFS transporter [Myxococcales bacterium]|nr:MFS transporter [Myxococcales bacterium]